MAFGRGARNDDRGIKIWQDGRYKPAVLRCRGSGEVYSILMEMWIRVVFFKRSVARRAFVVRLAVLYELAAKILEHRYDRHYRRLAERAQRSLLHERCLFDQEIDIGFARGARGELLQQMVQLHRPDAAGNALAA